MPQPFALFLPDARADGAVRHVSVSERQVTICRRYKGIAMRLVVPCALYRGIGLRRMTLGGQTRHEITLLHQDDELSVTLGPGAAEESARWAQWFNLPRLRAPRLAMDAPKPRRRSATLAKRRRRYALRRKPGAVSRAFGLTSSPAPDLQIK